MTTSRSDKEQPYWRQWITIWHDGENWTYSIDPEVPKPLMHFVREEAIKWCEELIFEDKNKGAVNG